MFKLDDITGVSSSNKAIFVKNGAIATKADIKVGDVVTFVRKSAGALNYVVITDNKVNGTISSLGIDTNSRYTPVISGTSYSASNVADNS